MKSLGLASDQIEGATVLAKKPEAGRRETLKRLDKRVEAAFGAHQPSGKNFDDELTEIVLCEALRLHPEDTFRLAH